MKKLLRPYFKEKLAPVPQRANTAYVEEQLTPAPLLQEISSIVWKYGSGDVRKIVNAEALAQVSAAAVRLKNVFAPIPRLYLSICGRGAIHPSSSLFAKLFYSSPPFRRQVWLAGGWLTAPLSQNST